MRKGFTLNELLAVLLILAIIALITTPIITGVMERVRKSAAGSSALGYISAVEKAIAESGYNKKKYVPGEVDILLADYYKDVDVNGDKPTKGTLNVADNLVIESSVLCVNNYRVEVEGHKVKNVIKNGCDNIKSPYQEELLKGTWPKLSGDLIPVTIDSDGGVKKANVYDEWYKYEDKRWANAVLLDDDKILDLSGNNNHGYLQAGATKGDNSVTTDGIDDYTYASLENYEYGSEFSIIIRFKLLSLDNSDTFALFGNLDASGSLLFIYNSHFSFQVYDTNYATIEAKETLAEVNTWYTLVGTVKDNKIYLYKDGKLVGEPRTIGTVKNSDLPFFIGNNMDISCDATTHTCSQFHHPSNIEFSDALIFDRTLSEEEIKKEFSDKIGDITNQSDLRLRYDLDDEIKNDTVLPEEVIESYFVWIPKFKYQLWDLGDYSSLGETVTNKAQEIKIEFDAGNTGNIDGKECVATNKSGDVGTCKVGDWMTHPAFTSLGVNGIWVGKFETGYKGANNKTTAQVDTNESQKIIIKPNVYGWRGIKVKNIFEASYNYERDLDSHMLKNTEW